MTRVRNDFGTFNNAKQQRCVPFAALSDAVTANCPNEPRRGLGYCRVEPRQQYGRECSARGLINSYPCAPPILKQPTAARRTATFSRRSARAVRLLAAVQDHPRTTQNALLAYYSTQCHVIGVCRRRVTPALHSVAEGRAYIVGKH